MIRALSISELHKAIYLANRFFILAKEPGVFNPDCFISFWVKQYEANKGVILAQTDSFNNVVAIFGFTLYNDPWTNDLNAGELFWHSEQGNSGYLVKKALSIAKQIGVKNFFLQHTTTLTPDKVEKFYRKLGFTPVFNQYRKEL